MPTLLLFLSPDAHSISAVVEGDEKSEIIVEIVFSASSSSFTSVSVPSLVPLNGSCRVP